MMLLNGVSSASHQKQFSFGLALNRAMLGFARHWLFFVSLLLGLFVGLPWLAPVFMQLGWTNAANVIYFLYATQCHQLPQRSFFLFGQQGMYSLAEIQAAWRVTNNPLILRQFIGNAQMGWKVAWSDRMVSMYTSIFLGSLLYWPIRRLLKPLPLWVFSLFVLPLAIDGSTHLLSDLAGIGQGFRDSNSWLSMLTGNALPASFYIGDSLGSFNSWARLVTGTLLGIGVVGLVYPNLKNIFADVAREIEDKLRRADFEA